MDGRFYAELLFLASALGAVLTFAVWGRDRRALPRIGEITATIGLGLLIVQTVRPDVVQRGLLSVGSMTGIDLSGDGGWRVLEIGGLSLVGVGVLCLCMLAGQDRRRRDGERAIASVGHGLSARVLESILGTTSDAALVLRRSGNFRRQFVVAVSGERAREILSPPATRFSEPPLSLHKPRGLASVIADAAERACQADETSETEWSTDDDQTHYGVRATQRGELVVVLIHDISDRKRSESALTEIAYTDPVTRLSNRAGAEASIFAEAAGVRDGVRRPFALLYLDFDGFKRVNDEYGHDAGDALLRSIAERMRDCLQASGYRRGNDFVAARWGGDEFVVMLREHNSPNARQVAERLCSELSAAHEVCGVRVVSTASIGMAWCDGRHVDGTAAVREADEAMYQAKRSGKNRVVLAAGDGLDGPGLATSDAA